MEHPSWPLTASRLVKPEPAVSALEIRIEILIWHIYSNLAEVSMDCWG